MTSPPGTDAASTERPSTVRTGRCLCGGVTVELTAEPFAVSLCHCVNCQKTSGSAFSVIAIVPKDRVRFTGRVSIFNDVGDSGIGFERCFCPGCGSPVESRSPQLAARGITIVKASLFDDTSWLQPNEQIYCESAQRWLNGGVEGIRRWPQMAIRNV
jgi:hypothetical protein